MSRRIILTTMALVLSIVVPSMASAQSFGGVSLQLTPNRTEVMRGDQVCFTLILTNTSTQTISQLPLNLFSNDREINFFLTSQGGEIHPGHTFWTLSLLPGQTMLIKARSQILTSTPGKIVRTILSIDDQAGAYADLHVLGLLPTTGADLSHLHQFTK